MQVLPKIVGDSGTPMKIIGAGHNAAKTDNLDTNDESVILALEKLGDKV